MDFFVLWQADIFNEKLTMNRYFYAAAEYNNFFNESIVQKLFNFKVNIFLLNGEETQVLIFPIFSMLFDVIHAFSMSICIK